MLEGGASTLPASSVAHQSRRIGVSVGGGTRRGGGRLYLTSIDTRSLTLRPPRLSFGTTSFRPGMAWPSRA
jgi:hypothetical protein